MSKKYKFTDNSKLYFVSFAVTNWIDLFVRDVYRNVLIDSIKHCQATKDLELYGWCIMTSHVHLIIGSSGNATPWFVSHEPFAKLIVFRYFNIKL